MADCPQDAPRHAGHVVRRVLLRRNIAVDPETAQLVADAVRAALRTGPLSRPPRRGPRVPVAGCEPLFLSGVGYPPACLRLPDNWAPGERRRSGVRAGGTLPWWASLPENPSYHATSCRRARQTGRGGPAICQSWRLAMGISSAGSSS